MVQIPRYIKVEVTGCIGIFALCVDQHVCIGPHICDLLSRRQLFIPHQIGPKPSVVTTRGVDSMERSVISQLAQLCSPLQETRCRDKSPQVTSGLDVMLLGSDLHNISKPPRLQFVLKMTKTTNNGGSIGGETIAYPKNSTRSHDAHQTNALFFINATKYVRVRRGCLDRFELQIVRQ